MQFLPTGSTPYQAYVKRELPSLASYLKQYGYETLACHFASGSNWNRDQVYPLLGFDTFLTDTDVGELEEIHGYPSDQADYEEVCRQYEAWKASGISEAIFPAIEVRMHHSIPADRHPMMWKSIFPC